MFCVLKNIVKNIDVNVFDDVLQNAKHRANDASNDVNRPPLSLPARVQVAETQAPGCLAAEQDTDDIIPSCLYSISLPGWPHVTLTQLRHAMRGPVSKAGTVIVNTANY